MYSENFSIKKGWAKKLEKDVVKDIDEVAKVVETVVKDAVKVLENVGEDVIFAPLLLFKPEMKAEIAKRGLTDNGTLLDITGKFIRALLKETPKASFDRFNALDAFGFPVAPIYIHAPVKAATMAIGISALPGLPDPADVLWNFFHKEAKKPGSPIAKKIEATKKAVKKDNGIQAKFSAFLHDPKKLLITGAIITAIVVTIIIATSKK